ncbi:MAG: DUF2085 domain-containing protein [Acidobacteria bacterium]|nr:DUF2085 domain-containing protein [Acidobacteriota bacterium]
MQKLHACLILFTGLWCSAILLPTLISADALRLFFAPICHQIPQRSLWLFGKPLAVCARCSGFYFGFLAALTLNFVCKISTRKGVLCGALGIVLLDALNGILAVYPDLALFRFGSATLFSFAVTPFLLQGQREAVDLIGKRWIQRL